MVYSDADKESAWLLTHPHRDLIKVARNLASKEPFTQQDMQRALIVFSTYNRLTSNELYWVVQHTVQDKPFQNLELRCKAFNDPNNNCNNALTTFSTQTFFKKYT